MSKFRHQPGGVFQGVPSSRGSRFAAVFGPGADRVPTRRATAASSPSVVVEGRPETYGRGEVELEKPDPLHKGTTTFPAGKSGRPCTLATVARFLGWTKPPQALVFAAFAARIPSRTTAHRLSASRASSKGNVGW
jgi:hypothetical protein